MRRVSFRLMFRSHILFKIILQHGSFHHIPSEIRENRKNSPRRHRASLASVFTNIPTRRGTWHRSFFIFVFIFWGNARLIIIIISFHKDNRRGRRNYANLSASLKTWRWQQTAACSRLLVTLNRKWRHSSHFETLCRFNRFPLKEI